MPKISILIPIYNVEQYIERCAISLFEQTLDDIEYIFVDDCTPDCSMELLETVLARYPKRKNQVRIIKHHVNLGLSRTRQDAILAATGEYIAHCDSDDWMAPDAMEKAYAAASKNNADICIFDFYASDGVNNRIVHVFPSAEVGSPEKFREMIAKGEGLGYIWLKLYRRAIVDPERMVWPVAYMAEDYIISIELAYFAKTAVYLNEPLYYYFDNPNSITMDHSVENIIRRSRGFAENTLTLESFFRQQNVAESYASAVYKLKFLSKHHLSRLVYSRKYYNMWRSCFPEVNLKSVLLSDFPPGIKIIYILVLLRIYPWLKNNFGNKR